MRKVIAAINMTVDGICDHTVIDADDEIHQHYSDLIRNAGTLIYGRITYQLMEYWPPIVKNPTGNKSSDEFAVAIDQVPKIVFSHTLKNVEWETARIAKRGIQEEIAALQQEPGKPIFVCSPSLIVQCTNLGLIDEYQLAVHPVIEGKGLPLFKNIKDRVNLKLLQTKKFGSGAVVFYYETRKEMNG
jgi:dihydrofolate reductase